MSTPSTASRLFRQTASTTARTYLKPPFIPSRQFTSPAAIRHRALRKVRITTQSRWLSTTNSFHAGIMPETEDPKPPQEDTSAATPRATQPTELSEDEYHQRADEFMDAINEKAEMLQEGREDVEVEFSAGVLSIAFPPNGTYIINKQPPNKQIWLSSPISGPKRYDWVLLGESMNQKEGSGTGEWVYLRDGSTLTGLLQKELGLLVDPHEEELTASKDPTE